MGIRNARFAGFVPGPQTLLTYLRSMIARRERRYLGQNPAGGAMIVALILTLSGIGLSGWMMGVDAWFGRDRVEALDEGLVSLALILVAAHVG